MNDILRLKDFSVHYPQKTALKDLSFQIKENETYAILGPSGCGKTTLLYAIADLLPIFCSTEGSCEKLKPLTVSTVLQDFGLFPWKTVLENTMLPLTLKGHSTDKDSEQARHILAQLKLDSHENHYPNELSGGQKQRVAIARSWLMKADLLLLDEPFSSLDALTREKLQDDVIDYYKKSPLTLILVTHNIEEAVYMGKTIILLTEDGSIQTLLDNPSFGIENVREHQSFYNQCLEIRKQMKEAKR